MEKKRTTKGALTHKVPARPKSPDATIKRVTMIPYGDPIRQAVASGDLAQMRRLEATAIKWLEATTASIQDVRKALRELRTAMKRV